MVVISIVHLISGGSTKPGWKYIVMRNMMGNLYRFFVSNIFPSQSAAFPGNDARPQKMFTFPC